MAGLCCPRRGDPHRGAEHLGGFGEEGKRHVVGQPALTCVACHRSPSSSPGSPCPGRRTGALSSSSASSPWQSGVQSCSQSRGEGRAPPYPIPAPERALGWHRCVGMALAESWQSRGDSDPPCLQPIASQGRPYLARSLNEMGALPGGALRTFWDPEYRTSISA